MSILQSLFLGLVQGLTEFLPVSSSGHLAIFKGLFNIDTGDSLLFDIMLHLGTLAVVIFVYWEDIVNLFLEFFAMIGDLLYNRKRRKENEENGTNKPLRRIIGTNYRKFVVLILVSTIPTGLLGVLGKGLVEDAAASMLVPGICLLITAVLLFVTDRIGHTTKIPQDATWQDGVLIGIVQGFATLPGISRSGSTIAACLLCGFDRKFAVKYSFILSIPAILGAAVLEIGDALAEPMEVGMVFTYLAGTVMAAVAGYFSIKALTWLLNKKRFRYFGFYCAFIGIVAIVASFFI